MKIAYWILVVLAFGALNGAGPVGEVFSWIVLLAAIGLWFLIKLGKSQTHEAANANAGGSGQTQPVVATARRSSGRQKETHHPSLPSGEPSGPWSPKTRQFEVAGEYYRQDNVSRLFKGIRISGPDGAELELPATLVPDPSNPFDRNAVAVYVNDLHVGYMERGDAATYHRPVADMASRGLAATVRSRQWARGRGGDVHARVTLSLPEPDGFMAANELPESAVILPAGNTIQVTRENEHMDVLTPWLNPLGREVSLAATLHAIIDIRARSAVEAVEVQVGGNAVGILTPTQTANLLPLVKFFNDRHLVPVACATLKGNTIKADLTLHVAKAQDVDPGWLDSHGPAFLATAPKVERAEFEWDDEPDLTSPPE